MEIILGHFNPRSREGSDKPLPMDPQHSDHFNPRSREGSDSYKLDVVFGYLEFQSTLPRGERLRRLIPYYMDKRISIHAPARGATNICTVNLANGSNFNPRSREGSDAPIPTQCHPPSHFNPRSREGSDIFGKYICHMPGNFNPRSREGSDINTEPGRSLSYMISIHAPARGATFPFSQLYIVDSISIHAPARGATWRLCRMRIRRGHFNPRSREGSDGF